MSAKKSNFIGKIHQGDCIEGLKKLPKDSVDLVFADPPFNIGFEYDEYDDRLDDDQYLQWSQQWMAGVHRALKSNGTFWLAIGDEYAAELKLAAQKTGFHCRSWVIWYYTFGVNCKKKFTRSHAHLFHFVKNETDFVFNHDDLDLRVPSARRLIYNDARANPNGRMPDDTWILRPQELVNGFEPDENTWYFPRVAGTFKERAGFHGCQMPEQLLGRIIRTCSNPGDVILDPFSGSSSTLVVAKKLGRKFFGFELSKEYVRLGTKRLKSVSVGDDLTGSPEPTMSELLKKERKLELKSGKKQKQQKLKKHEQKLLSLFPDEETIHGELSVQLAGLIDAFGNSNQGYSLDRVVADPILNEDFQLACDRLSISGTPAERNRFMFRVRKSGKFKSLGLTTSATTKISWKQITPFLYASEIAWRQISNKYNLSLDEIFCDPRIASQFDEIANQFAPGYHPLDYRWAAIKLRKEGSAARQRATLKSSRQLGISDLSKKRLKDNRGVLLSQLNFESIPNGPGVYLIRGLDGDAFYAGETNQLATRLKATFDLSGPRSRWLQHSDDLEIHLLSVDSIPPHDRFARQSLLLKWHQPQWNQIETLTA